MKYLQMIDSYKITSKNGFIYIVSVERVKNDRNGNGRAKYSVFPARGGFGGYVYKGFATRGGALDAAEAVEQFEKDFLNA